MENPNNEQTDHGTSSSSRPTRIDRNLMEKNRRNHMKNLYSKLYTLIPPQHSKLSVVELVEQATIYIPRLQEKIKELKETKDLLKGDCGDSVINIKSSEFALEVSIISGLKKKFMLHQVIGILEEEGARVVSTTYHTAGDKVFCTVLSQVSSRIGIETWIVEERLKILVS